MMSRGYSLSETRIISTSDVELSRERQFEKRSVFGFVFR
jgi:hypothetical protein